jgi:D-xylose transport system ATP-binding protein
VSAAAVELSGVWKRYGGVNAVEDAHLAVAAGEVVGLLGHNGAGKSTLVKVLAGAEPADAGEIRVAGEPASIRSPRDARALGIETLHQNLALAENLDVAANVFLGRERVTRFGLLDDAAMERAARDVLARLAPAFDRFHEPVRRLSGGERQAVAIARAVQFRARILILDEPTAALGPEETRSVVSLVRRLAGEGVAILLVSHDLHDVFELADRVVVMRRGRVVGHRRTRDVTRDDVLRLIIAGGSA